MRDLFLRSPWPGTIAWALIYISDYFLTITCARLYRRNMSNKIAFEGSFELNPIFQRDIDSLRLLSPRFLILLVLTSTLFTLFWTANVPSTPELYMFMIGAFICMELAIHVRHLGNLHLFSSALVTGQLRGRIEYDRPLILRMSAVQAFAFAILFAVVFLFTGSWFVGGGMVSCFILSLKHLYLSGRAARIRAEKAAQAVVGT